MWPKVLAQFVPQLIDILPHLRRMAPMADKYLASKQASDVAITAMAKSVRDDLGQVTAAHAGLLRQLQANSLRLDDALNEARSSRVAAELAQNHAAEVERQLRSLSLWIKLGVSSLLVLLLIAIALLVRAR